MWITVTTKPTPDPLRTGFESAHVFPGITESLCSSLHPIPGWAPQGLAAIDNSPPKK
jgi:hypothetical protein